MAKIVKNAVGVFATAFDRYFQHGSFLRNVATLSSGSAAGNVILLATTPIISRLYPPETFGVFSVFLSVFSIGSVFATLNLQLALPLPRRDGTAANLMVSSLAVLGVFTLVSAVIVQLTSGAHGSLPVIREMGPYAGWLPAAFLGAGLNVVLYYWLLRRRDYAVLAMVKVCQSGTMAAGQIVLGLLGSTAFGLIVGHILSQFIGALAFAWRIVRNDKQIFGRVTGVRVKRVFASYRDFSLKYTPGHFVSTLSLMLPPILLTAMFDVAVAGLYAFTTRAIRGGLALIVQSVTRVAYIRSVELRNSHDYVNLLSFYLKLCGRLAVIGIIPFSLLFFLGDDIFALVFGEDWRRAGVVATYLVPGLYGFLVLDHSLHIFVIMNMQYMKFLWELSRFVLMAVVFLIGKLWNLDAMTVILGLALAQAVGYFAVFVLCVRIIGRARTTNGRT